MPVDSKEVGKAAVALQRAHIYRDSEGLLGGVCGGFAQAIDVDAALIRLLVVVLTIISIGAFAFVYVLVWLIMPPEPQRDTTLEVDASALKSEVYEQVVMGVRPAVMTASSAASAPASVPPQPPRAASAYYAQQALPSVSYGVSAPVGQDVHASRKPVVLVLIMGVVSLVLGAAVLFSNLSGRFAFVQFWPLLLIAFGAVRMVLPAKDGTRMFTSWLGGLVAFVGIIVLVSSLGLYTIDAYLWLSHAGPLLLICVGLFIMGRAAKSDILIVCAGVALVAFVLVGAYFSLHESVIDVHRSLPMRPDILFEWPER